MDNNKIKQYKLEIAENENLMLGYYKDLVVAYEELREIYEEIIKEYENDAQEIIECSKISGLNHSTHIVRWSLVNLDGETVHVSEKYHPAKKWTLDLSDLKLKAHEKLILKVHFYNETISSEQIIEYIPTSKGKALFEIIGLEQVNELKYIGEIYPI